MKKTNTGNIRRGFLFASLGSVGWGISGVCSQYLFTKYDLRADWLTAVRMLLSGLVLLLLVFRKEKIRTFTIWKNRKDVGQLLAFALFGLLMCQYTFLGAIKYSNSATATVLQSLNVIFMAVIVAIQSRTRMGIQQTLAILLALVGTFLIATKGNPTRMQLSAAGLVLGLLAAAGVVIYTLLSRHIIPVWGNLPSPDGACSSVASSCFWAQGHGSYRPILTLQHGS
ncbi:DMT family transporter [Oscillospiraceae bacterium NTUH-002-81]|nr:DMT family transporter [Oscillospiraceae bacterium NTUH-002-81]